MTAKNAFKVDYWTENHQLRSLFAAHLRCFQDAAQACFGHSLGFGPRKDQLLARFKRNHLNKRKAS